MGQIEIIKILKKTHKWYKVEDVKQVLKKKGLSTKDVGSDLLILAAFGLVEMRGVNFFDHYKVFRYIKPKK
jgi:hypothetical protein